MAENIAGIEVPPLYTAEQEAQIMKGRRSQADIDAGRQIIQQRINDRNRALELAGKTSERADAEARRAEQNSPYEQGRQIALFGVPYAAGTAYGYKKGAGVSAGVKEGMTANAANLKNLADDVRAGRITQADALQTAKRMGLTKTRPGVGPLLAGMALAAGGAAQRNFAPSFTDNEIGQDVVRGLGGLESGVGTGVAVQQLFDRPKAYPQASASDMATVTGKGPKPGSGPAAPSSPGSPPALPPAAASSPQNPGGTPPQSPAAPTTRPHADRLISAAREAGATGNLNKARAAAFLAVNVTDENRTTIARELNVKPGPNFAKRVGAAVKTMASKPGASAIGPVAAGVMAYDAVTGDAEAAGDDAGAARTKGAAAGTAAAGLTAGAGKVAPHIVKQLAQSLLGRAALRAVPPIAAGMTATMSATTSPRARRQPRRMTRSPSNMPRRIPATTRPPSMPRRSSATANVSACECRWRALQAWRSRRRPITTTCPTRQPPHRSRPCPTTATLACRPTRKPPMPCGSSCSASSIRGRCR